MKRKGRRLGAAIDIPHEVKMLQEPEYNTYRKLVLEQNGTTFATTAPVEICVSEDYMVWTLSDKLMIAYNPRAQHENLWWSDLMSKLPEPLQRCPKMKGDLCVYVYWNGLNWNELILRRELINWLVCRYKRGHQYHFCDFSDDGEQRPHGRCTVV